MIYDVPSIEPLDSSLQSQRIRILPDAQSYRHVDIYIGLYLEDPIPEATINRDRIAEKSLVQQMILRIQIASHHRYDANSSFLLVTSCTSTESRVRTIQRFIREDLKLELDEWNVSLYGGFQYPVEENQDQPVDVTVAYHGKSIIFLGERFEFFGTTNRTIAEFCDIRALSEAIIKGTCCIFLGSSNDTQLKVLLRRLVFPLPMAMRELAEGMSESQKFNSKKDMLHSLEQSKLLDAAEFKVYAVPLKGRWYRLGKENPAAESRRLARYLRRRLPQERFLVAPAEDIEIFKPGVDHQQTAGQGGLRKLLRKKQSETARRGLAVLHGASHGMSAMASEPCKIPYASMSNASLPNLPPFEALLLVQSLPIAKRLDLLWELPSNDDPRMAVQISEDATKCLFFSILFAVDFEIRAFLSRAKWPNSISIPKKREAALAFIGVHLPILSRLLRHPQASHITRPPERIVEILQYAEACCLPQKKRHIVRATVMPLCQRRTELRKCLQSILNNFLQNKSYTKKEVANFRNAAGALHSYTDRERRDTLKVLLKQVSEFTKKTEHQHRFGQCTSSTVVPRTTYCTAQEWHDQLQAIDTARDRMREESRSAREKLSRMILDVPGEGDNSSARELPI